MASIEQSNETMDSCSGLKTEATKTNLPEEVSTAEDSSTNDNKEQVKPNEIGQNTFTNSNPISQSVETSKNAVSITDEVQIGVEQEDLDAYRELDRDSSDVGSDYDDEDEQIIHSDQSDRDVDHHKNGQKFDVLDGKTEQNDSQGVVDNRSSRCHKINGQSQEKNATRVSNDDVNSNDNTKSERHSSSSRRHSSNSRSKKREHSEETNDRHRDSDAKRTRSTTTNSTSASSKSDNHHSRKSKESHKSSHNTDKSSSSSHHKTTGLKTSIKSNPDEKSPMSSSTNQQPHQTTSSGPSEIKSDSKASIKPPSSKSSSKTQDKESSKSAKETQSRSSKTIENSKTIDNRSESKTEKEKSHGKETTLKDSSGQAKSDNHHNKKSGHKESDSKRGRSTTTTSTSATTSKSDHHSRKSKESHSSSHELQKSSSSDHKSGGIKTNTKSNHNASASRAKTRNRPYSPQARSPPRRISPEGDIMGGHRHYNNPGRGGGGGPSKLDMINRKRLEIQSNNRDRMRLMGGSGRGTMLPGHTRDNVNSFSGQHDMGRRQREENERLAREQMKLRIERENFEREKEQFLRAERERTAAERERLAREREDLRKRSYANMDDNRLTSSGPPISRDRLSSRDMDSGYSGNWNSNHYRIYNNNNSQGGNPSSHVKSPDTVLEYNSHRYRSNNRRF